MSVRNATTSKACTLIVLLVLTVACGDTAAPSSESGGSSPSLLGNASGDDAEPAELIGVTWLVTGFLDGASVYPPSGHGRIRFEQNGFVTGSDGCNGFGYALVDEGEGEGESPEGLAYTISGEQIHFTGASVSTLIGCSDNEYEVRLHHVLAGIVTYEMGAAPLE